METSTNASTIREHRINSSRRPLRAHRPNAVHADAVPASPPDGNESLVMALMAARQQAKELELQLDETRKELRAEFTRRQRAERQLGSYKEHLEELEQVLELV